MTMKHWDRLNDLDSQLSKLADFNEMLELMVEGLQSSGDVPSRFTGALFTFIQELENELMCTRASFDQLWREVRDDSDIDQPSSYAETLDVTTSVKKLAKKQREKPAVKAKKKIVNNS